MFKEALRSVVEGTEGSIAGLLMDFEGIPVESFTRDGSNFDIETVGAEVSVVVKAIQRAGEMLDVGDTQEVALKSEKMTTLIRIINQTYLVAITTDPERNLGKGRFLRRVLAPKLAQELATCARRIPRPGFHPARRIFPRFSRRTPMHLSLEELKNLFKTLEAGGVAEFEYQDEKYRVKVGLARPQVVAAAPARSSPVASPGPIAP